jgi:MFS family permease
MKTDERSPGTADVVGSAWSPFRQTVFTVLWVVQAATTLPMFLFSLPAGALADIVDRRRVLIVVQIVAVAIARGPL